MTRTLAVIGAGSMGSGIAAHMANAGHRVILLDVTGDIARAGIHRQLAQKGFHDPASAERITPGSIDADLHLLADAEWIVEAIVENLDAKRELYAKLAGHRRPGALVSSNTSTIPLAALTEGLDEDFRAHFAITHFFNPPRLMRLVEVVGPAGAALTGILREELGKHVLGCRDTPGFIANRVGSFWMSAGASIALERGIAIELADAAFARPVGVPRTGIFGLFDYIGRQVVPGIWDSLLSALAPDDTFHRYDGLVTSAPISWLLEHGHTGRTGDSGFWRGRGEVLDPDALAYRQVRPVTDPVTQARGIAQAIEVDSAGGRYVWEVFATTLAYCCEVAPEIAESVADVDAAMELGYSWKQGPFRMADSIGLDEVRARLTAEGREIPALLADATAFYPRPGQALATDGTVADLPADAPSFAELTREAEIVFANDGAVVHRFDDGVGVLSITTPMNACTADVLDALLRVGDCGLTALVIGNDRPNVFSAGANLPQLADIAASGDQAIAEQVIELGSRAMRAVRHLPIPVVAAARGTALGGGAELLLHCDRVVAHTELRVGFPERLVGLIPAWNGSVRVLQLMVEAGVDDPHQAAFDLIMSAAPTDSAAEARNRGLLAAEDELLMNPDDVPARALALARELSGGYRAPVDKPLALTTATLDAAWHGEGVAEADRDIATALAGIYTGDGEISTEELAARERLAGAKLIVKPKNAARAAHMAAHRRPLKDS